MTTFAQAAKQSFFVVGLAVIFGFGAAEREARLPNTVSTTMAALVFAVPYCVAYAWWRESRGHRPFWEWLLVATAQLMLSFLLWCALDAVGAKQPGALWEKGSYTTTIPVLARQNLAGPAYTLPATLRRGFGGYEILALHMPNGGVVTFETSAEPIVASPYYFHDMADKGGWSVRLVHP